ncbi:TPA: site-specific DNA-methyltransferase [Clostridium botulinum]|nr:site-specific DNA-methyltransferase [Clostridium botulinum]HCL4455148.1 site-specific DNA-methyltransferase [Clostridium botulinum]
MNRIPNKSIDMILCDLPYGTTNRNKWDIVIPFDKLWKQYERIIKDNGAILLFSDEPFTSELICSNKKIFKQRITWDKDRGSGFLNAKKMLLKQTEDICLFYKKTPTYNPQMTQAKPDRIRPNSAKGENKSFNYGEVKTLKHSDNYDKTIRYPTNLIKFSSMTGDCNNLNRIHPTQKPRDLLKWLINTYSNKNELILDNCIGSGQTAIACLETNRNYIGFDNGKCDKKGKSYSKYWADISQERINTYLHNKKIS